jgi:hypothetical protein
MPTRRHVDLQERRVVAVCIEFAVDQFCNDSDDASSFTRRAVH